VNAMKVYEVVLCGKTIEIRRPKNTDEYRKLMDVQVEIWGMPDYSEAVTYHMLISADRHGGLVLGAFEKDTGKPVGLVFGIPGYLDGKIFHYSHIAGVVSDYRYKGLGYILKLKQREFVLKQGLDLIVWTYDPLQGSNAKFNVGKLGVIVRKFYRDYYGELRDQINIGMPTDRFEAEWWIKSRRVELKLQKKLKPPPLKHVLSLGADLVTETRKVDDYRKLENYNLKSNSKLLVVEIPGDLNKLRKNRGVLLEWRYGLREVFKSYLNKGYIAMEFISEFENGLRRNFYVLWKESLDKILKGETPWRENLA